MRFNNIFVRASLSVLRKLTVHGFQEPQQNIEVMVSIRSALIAIKPAAFCVEFEWRVSPVPVCEI